MSFDLDRLEVDQRALRLVASVEATAKGLPAQHADLRDQMRSAAASILLNIAEGAGEFSPAEKSRLYRIARRSATETAAALDLAHAWGLSEPQTRAQREIREIAAILTTLVHKFDEEARSRRR